MDKTYYVYLLTNWSNKVMYVGVTSNLLRRVWEHREKLTDGFTQQYNLDKLVYYEFFEDMLDAIKREKQIKSGPRKNKDKLINKFNPKWDDLYDSLG